jgi:hypothetical protein
MYNFVEHPYLIVIGLLIPSNFQGKTSFHDTDPYGLSWDEE